MSISVETMTAYSILELLSAKFGDEVKTNVVLAPYTSARIGGRADILVGAQSADELAAIVTLLWQEGIEPVVLGGGSNVLVSDKGIRGVTVINRAKDVRFDEGQAPSVWAESGVVFSNLANRCAIKGLAGLEWAGTVPGTIGGAVYGNAGAFGGDMAGSLKWAEVLTKAGRERWPVESMGYGYRTSMLKRRERSGLVLAAELRLNRSTRETVSARMTALGEQRKSTQPPGASMGSMFKNPAGDKAGRLIEAAGLKGRRVGNVEISPVHGNFFVNHGRANAADVKALIEIVQRTVKERLGVELELEIELVGEGMQTGSPGI
ncbi:MAG: UDP-N-acetylmuramate dehydrogenase [Chloroflexota bacterium]